MDITAEYKDTLGKELTLALAAALEKNEITQESAQEAAGFILDKIDGITTKEQLDAFLTELSSKWSLFSNILTLEKAEASEKQDEQKVEEMQTLIKENKLDEALQVGATAAPIVGGAQ